MKHFIAALILTMTTASIASAQTAPASKEVTIGLNEVYVPGGFSATTDVYVIASGLFPNSCYKWARAEVTNTTPLMHEVKSIATVSQTMCLMVMIPYTKEIKLGRLQTGDHTLRFVNGDGTYFEKTLTVE
jgi:hypothetical protein